MLALVSSLDVAFMSTNHQAFWTFLVSTTLKKDYSLGGCMAHIVL
jgi:hypothetical protein